MSLIGLLAGSLMFYDVIKDINQTVDAYDQARSCQKDEVVSYVDVKDIGNCEKNSLK